MYPDRPVTFALILRIILRVEPRLGVIGFPSNGSASLYVSTLPPSSDGRASAASAAACGSFVMGAGGLVSAIVWPGAQRRGNRKRDSRGLWP